MVPFASYFFSCTVTEEVTIEIFELFDNDFFGLKSIDFLVPNEALQFKSARIRVKTYLNGVRYLMAEWFFTFALTCILTMTTVFSVCVTIALFFLRRLYLLSWI